jgi:cytochrome P450
LSLTLSLTANLTKKVHKTLALPNGAANLHNPSLPQPSKWDGFRFHELRQLSNPNTKPASQNQYEWGTSTRSDLDFGYGAHACPGRAVGCNMLKIFLTLLLEKYELKPEEGVTERYEDVHIGQYVSYSHVARGLDWRWC